MRNFEVVSSPLYFSKQSPYKTIQYKTEQCTDVQLWKEERTTVQTEILGFPTEQQEIVVLETVI
jgi:hypothetical protein